MVTLQTCAPEIFRSHRWGQTGGSRVRRPGSEDPHRREQKFWCSNNVCQHQTSILHPTVVQIVKHGRSEMSTQITWWWNNKYTSSCRVSQKTVYPFPLIICSKNRSLWAKSPSKLYLYTKVKHEYSCFLENCIDLKLWWNKLKWTIFLQKRFIMFLWCSQLIY